MDILDALSRRPEIRHITTRHEQGAAFMADVHGRLTGRVAVAMGTLGPGGDQPRDGRRRRLPRPRADGRAHRPGVVGEAPQGGPPGRRHRADVRAGHEVEHAGRAGDRDPGDRPQGVPRRDAGEAGPDAHRAARERRRDGAPLADRGRPRAPGPGPDLLPGAHRRGDRPRREAPRRLRAAADPRRQRRPASRARPRTCAPSRAASTSRSRRRSWARARSTTARTSRSSPSGLQARDHVLSGFDRADLIVCVGYDLVECGPGGVEPGRDQADPPHRHAAGGDRRRVPAGGRARRRHRRDAAAAPRRGPAARDRRPGRRRAPRVQGDPGPRRPAHGHAARARGPRRERRLADHPAARDRRPAARARPARHRRERRRRPQDLGRAAVPGVRAEHGDHLQRVRRDGHRDPGRDRRGARPPGPQGRGPVRRRRVPDEQPGARDRDPRRRRTSRS